MGKIHFSEWEGQEKRLKGEAEAEYILPRRLGILAVQAVAEGLTAALLKEVARHRR